MRRTLSTFFCFLFFLFGTTSCKSSNYSYDTIIIEIQGTSSNYPHQFQLNKLSELFDTYKICKKDFVSFVINEKINTHQTEWFKWQTAQFEADHRTLHDNEPNDRDLILWMGFFPGRFLELNYDNVIGLNYGPTSTLIIGSETKHTIRIVTMFHEVLHAIGLVNRSVRAEKPINPERPNHCNNTKCTMYWTVPSKPFLCLKCQSDLLKLRK